MIYVNLLFRNKEFIHINISTMKSFGAKNPEDQLKEIITEYYDFVDNHLNATKANNICVNLWQLNDWIYKFYNIEDSIPVFRNKLFESCPYLRVVHDIANASKHFELDRSKSSLKEARKHEGVFDHTFDSSFDMSKLEVVLEDDVTISDKNLIKTALDFWIKFFLDNYEIGISNENI